MMGTHQPQPSLFAYRVDLEQRIRPDHPLRRVRERVDFSFVRAQSPPATATKATCRSIRS